MFSGQPANLQPQPLQQEPVQPEIPQASRFSFLKSAKVWPIIVLLALLIPTGTYFLGKSQSNNQPQTVQSSPTPTPLSSKASATEDDPTVNWQTYNNSNLSIKYPPTWNLKTSDYLQSGFQLENSNGTVGVIVSEGQYPYSLQGPSDFKQQILTISINGKLYEAIEYIDSNKAYTDLDLKTSKEYHVLFGTGYPSGDDNKASISDYQKDRNTIIAILSTFTFTPLSTSKFTQ